ncbi:DUF4124 domain-containing protein [Aliikangiella maris]|uniref:DUF4124 domain-containing protein n=2 Tax=Aliikangiella maris TaxID=3162458 RepID=A0ABV2BP88_9GAMM
MFIVIIGALQIFGGRDFGQITLAWDKYASNGTLSSFIDDVVIIFKGDKIKESVFPHSRYAKKVVYRWTDANGEVHVSERMPTNVKDYEEIQLGDMEFQIQESMGDDITVKKANKKKDDN